MKLILFIYFLCSRYIKEFLILFFIFFLKPSATANDSVKFPFLYAEAFAGFSNGNSFGIGGNILLNNSWGFNVSFNQGDKKSIDVPGNYQHGLCILTCDPPSDKFYAYTYRIAKTFGSFNKFVRLKTELGLILLNYHKVYFIPLAPTSAWFNFGSNYIAKYSIHKEVGISTRILVECPFSQLGGVQFGLNASATKSHLSAGFEFGMTLGYARNKWLRHVSNKSL